MNNFEHRKQQRSFRKTQDHPQRARHQACRVRDGKAVSAKRTLHRRDFVSNCMQISCQKRTDWKVTAFHGAQFFSAVSPGQHVVVMTQTPFGQGKTLPESARDSRADDDMRCILIAMNAATTFHVSTTASSRVKIWITTPHRSQCSLKAVSEDGCLHGESSLYAKLKSVIKTID